MKNLYLHRMGKGWQGDCEWGGPGLVSKDFPVEQPLSYSSQLAFAKQNSMSVTGLSLPRALLSLGVAGLLIQVAFRKGLLNSNLLCLPPLPLTTLLWFFKFSNLNSQIMYALYQLRRAHFSCCRRGLEHEFWWLSHCCVTERFRLSAYSSPTRQRISDGGIGQTLLSCLHCPSELLSQARRKARALIWAWVLGDGVEKQGRRMELRWCRLGHSR